MRITVNPGSSVELTGSFQLGASLERVRGLGCGDLVADGPTRQLVIDRESHKPVLLADLLRSLLADPTDTVTGPIRITIQPDQAPSILEQAWRVAMSGPRYAVAENVGDDDGENQVLTIDPDTIRSTAEEAEAAWKHERCEVEGYDEAVLPPYTVVRLP